MLVLGRKIGETITIEGVGMIKLVSVSGGSARIALDIDKSFNIIRDELPRKTGVPGLRPIPEAAPAKG